MSRHFSFILVLLPFLSIAQTSVRETDLASFYVPGQELVIDEIQWSNERVVVQYSSPRAFQLDVSLVSYVNTSTRRVESENLLDAMCDDETCRIEIVTAEFDPQLEYYLRFQDVNTDDTFLSKIDLSQSEPVPVVVTNALDDLLLQGSFQKGIDIYPKSMGIAQQISVNIYQEPFDPADPPSGYRGLPAKDLRPTQRITVQSGERLQLGVSGLYFLQTDGSGSDGYAFRVQDPPYPEYNSLEDLASCMIYISTASEWKTLSTNLTKSEFDRIWLKAGGNENNARSAIKNYFGRIQMANVLFTTFKEGWKTDKGMVYTVFGAPAHVYVDGDSETWEYNMEYRGENVRFEFIHRANVFDPDHWVLERKSEYTGIWHFAIDNLRKGIMFN